MSRWAGQVGIRGTSQFMQMILLTICVAGLQFTWGVEMSYVNVYLLSLGMTKSILSIVWIAGPISGLLMQPIIGVLSDNCTSRWGRRRPYMIVGSFVVSLGLIIMAWAKDISDLMFVGNTSRIIALIIATIAIFVTDFSINAVQACCRAIIVDTLPPESQELGNGWAGRMIAIGHLIGYFCGAIELVKLTGGWLGDTQLKALVIISSLALLLCVAITSASVSERILLTDEEDEEEDDEGKIQNKNTIKLLISTVADIFITLRNTIGNLPPKIALIFKIQLCAWYGWFGFLFYSATWVGEVYYGSINENQPDSKDPVGEMARKGATALVVFSFVSLASSLILPELITKSSSVIRRHSSPNLNSSTSKWKLILQSIISLIIIPFTFLITQGQQLFIKFNIELPDVWFAAHIVYSIATFSTAFVKTVPQATVVVALCGFSWAITTWAPFALLGEEILKLDNNNLKSNISDEEREPIAEDNLINNPSPTSDSSSQSGVYLGIHNVSITIPQLVATFMSFIIFSIFQDNSNTELNSRSSSPIEKHSDGGLAIARTLQIGSLTALGAAYLTRKYRKL